MNLNNILWVCNTRKILPKAPVVENLFGMNLGCEGIIITTTGNPVSIITNKAQNAISTLLSYSPKQSGSGDPSPSNVRPISGWTEANLGVNSETPTTTISIGGTYYGFTVDVERGVLRVTQVGIVYDGSDDENWGTINLPLNVFGVPGLTGYDSADMCDGYKMISRGSSGGLADLECRLASSRATFMVRNTNYATLDAIKASLALSPITVVYTLATPTELPLTPQTVALLAGNNTLWTDGDEIEIIYRR